MNTIMKQGDFTGLAKDYAMSRPDYSSTVLRALLSHTGARNALDVGAGTGIWTRMLAEEGLDCQAVEPCEAMREEGKAHTADFGVSWCAGSAEETCLADGMVDWITMASSFHWTDPRKSLPEFHRVLKPGGLLTVLWNPRNIAGHALHEEIEQLILENEIVMVRTRGVSTLPLDFAINASVSGPPEVAAAALVGDTVGLIP